MKEINIHFVSRLNIDIEQGVGQREDATISQKAISKELDEAKKKAIEETEKLHKVFSDEISEFQKVLTQQSIKYHDLLALRNESKLVPGCQYRITDYITITNAGNSQSAGHQFDILVVADTASTLNENAHATLHYGDDYFIKSNLSAWKLKYCLDNDSARFSWAYPDEPTGIQINGEIFQRDESSDVYYQDEYYVAYTNGDTVFYAKGIISSVEAKLYDYWYGVRGEIGWIMEESTCLIQCIHTGEIKGKGVIYYLEDEFGNTAGYDFKNIQFKALEDIDTLHIKAGNYYYTFSKTDDNGNISDNSLNDKCRRNVIEEYYEKSYCLGNNVFNCTSLLPSCSHNYLGYNSRDNLFGGVCHRNKLGVGCYGNIFDGSNADNILGNQCHNNNIGQGSERNVFYAKCSENTLGLVCIGNIFMNDCNGKILDRYTSYETMQSPKVLSEEQ